MPKSNLIFQSQIERLDGINKACKYIAKKLKYRWAWKYLYHVYRGTAQPSRKLTRKLNALRLPEPPRKRHRKIIEATSKEQLDQWNALTADQLRHALDREIVLRRIK